jgi:hypothetical protein
MVNEKTLELNITHELMSSLNANVLAPSTRAERRFPADVALLTNTPMIIQYKAPKRGIDGQAATFEINNNTRNTQHRSLDALSRIPNPWTIRYGFPLVVTNGYLIDSLGSLSRDTQWLSPSQITDSVQNIQNPGVRNRWLRQPHEINVNSGGGFAVFSSNKGEGKASPTESLVQEVSRKIRESQPVSSPEVTLEKQVEQTIDRMEEVLTEHDLGSRTEHTINFFARNQRTGQLSYVQFVRQLKP